MSKFFEERDSAIRKLIYNQEVYPLWEWVHKYTFPSYFARDIPDEYGVKFELWAYEFCCCQSWLTKSEINTCFVRMKKLYDKIENEPEV